MIKISRRRKFDCCARCNEMSRGSYCTKCGHAVCADCARTHIAIHRSADSYSALKGT